LVMAVVSQVEYSAYIPSRGASVTFGRFIPLLYFTMFLPGCAPQPVSSRPSVSAATANTEVFNMSVLPFCAARRRRDQREFQRVRREEHTLARAKSSAVRMLATIALAGTDPPVEQTLVR